MTDLPYAEPGGSAERPTHASSGIDARRQACGLDRLSPPPVTNPSERSQSARHLSSSRPYRPNIHSLASRPSSGTSLSAGGPCGARSGLPARGIRSSRLLSRFEAVAWPVTRTRGFLPPAGTGSSTSDAWRRRQKVRPGTTGWASRRAAKSGSRERELLFGRGQNGFFIKGPLFWLSLGQRAEIPSNTSNATEQKGKIYRAFCLAKPLIEKVDPASLNQRVPGSSPGAPTTALDRLPISPSAAPAGSPRARARAGPARVAGCSGSSGWRTASLAITPPSAITVLVARRPHWRFS